jgi:addiction module HigA family antidote
MAPLKMTVNFVAAQADIDRVTLSRILNGHRNVTAETSVKLGHLFGVNDGFFLDLQSAVDLWNAKRTMAARPVHLATSRTRVKRVVAMRRRPGKAARR